MSVSAQAVETIRSTLDNVTSTAENGVAGLVFTAVDKNGKTLASHASGNIGLETKKPMTMDTVFWIASCTKMITGIACMQLVEQNKLALDDAKLVEKLCPELKNMKVLTDSGELVDRKGDITLRMLLSHSAGFSYHFFSEKLRKWGMPEGLDEFSGDPRDILLSPLCNQPGERWEYGTNIDWAGLLVERASGLGLNAYFKKYIFEPLGLQHISMFPTAEMKRELAHMHQRYPDGSIEEREHLHRRALTAETPEEQERIFNSGGAGCFARPTDYVQILSVLLNEGVHAPTGHRLLQASTVDAMFENQIPQWPDFARQGIPAANKMLTGPAPELYPQEGNPPQGWGLTFFLNLEKRATGSGDNTAWWAGLSNLFWWADREKGVAGMVASQILPFGDLNVLGAWFACEKAIYDGLQKA